MARSSRLQRPIMGGILLILALSGCIAQASAFPPRTPFVRRDGVVCARKQDIVKIRKSLNTLRHFGQIRALVRDGRCQIYAQRMKVVDFKPSNPSDRFEAVQIRTEDKPDITRWILRKDVREATHSRPRS